VIVKVDNYLNFSKILAKIQLNFTKIQSNKRKTARTFSSPFPSPHTRVQELSAGFSTLVVHTH
jgi:hypothetical protein